MVSCKKTSPKQDVGRDKQGHTLLSEKTEFYSKEQYYGFLNFREVKIDTLVSVNRENSQNCVGEYKQQNCSFDYEINVTPKIHAKVIVEQGHLVLNGQLINLKVVHNNNIRTDFDLLTANFYKVSYGSVAYLVIISSLRGISGLGLRTTYVHLISLDNQLEYNSIASEYCDIDNFVEIKNRMVFVQHKTVSYLDNSIQYSTKLYTISPFQEFNYPLPNSGIFYGESFGNLISLMPFN